MWRNRISFRSCSLTERDDLNRAEVATDSESIPARFCVFFGPRVKNLWKKSGSTFTFGSRSLRGLHKCHSFIANIAEFRRHWWFVEFEQESYLQIGKKFRSRVRIQKVSEQEQNRSLKMRLRSLLASHLFMAPRTSLSSIRHSMLRVIRLALDESCFLSFSHSVSKRISARLFRVTSILNFSCNTTTRLPQLACQATKI